MTGLVSFNFRAFDEAARHWLNRDYVVFNPADDDRKLLDKSEHWYPEASDSVGPWKAWADHLKPPTLRQMLCADLSWICEHADSIYMLKGWENSKGAMTEWSLAKTLGLNIHYQ